MVLWVVEGPKQGSMFLGTRPLEVRPNSSRPMPVDGDRTHA